MRLTAILPQVGRTRFQPGALKASGSPRRAGRRGQGPTKRSDQEQVWLRRLLRLIMRATVAVRMRAIARCGRKTVADDPSAVSVDAEKSLIALAVESWRFSKVFERLAHRLDAVEIARYVSQLDYFRQRIEENLASIDLTLVNMEGHDFDPGMAVRALNLDDFAPDDTLVIEQMIEPIVMGSEGLRRQGAVLLRRRHE